MSRKAEVYSKMRIDPKVKFMLTVCIISALIVPVWISFIVPEMQKIPDDYESTVMFLGEVQWRNGLGEELSEPFMQLETHTERTVDVKGKYVELELESVVENPLTAEIFWQVKNNITVEIVTDSPLLQSMMMMFSDPMYATSDGGKLEKIKRQKAIVKFNPDTNRGDIKIVIANRFLVTVTGNRTTKEDLKAYAKAIDYKKLTAMHFYAWSTGLKTGIYYLRRKAKHQAQQFTIEPSTENSNSAEELCEMCSA